MDPSSALDEFEEVQTLRAILCDDVMVTGTTLAIRVNGTAVVRADYHGCVAGMLPDIRVDVEEDTELATRLQDTVIRDAVKRAQEAGEAMIVFNVVEAVRDAMVAAAAAAAAAGHKPAPRNAPRERKPKQGGGGGKTKHQGGGGGGGGKSKHGGGGGGGSKSSHGKSHQGGSTSNAPPAAPNKVKIKKPVVAASNTSLVLSEAQEERLCTLLGLQLADSATAEAVVAQPMQFASVVSQTSDKRTMRRLDMVYMQLESMGVAPATIGQCSERKRSCPH